MAIQVNLDDHTGNVSHQAKMDENAEVAQLIPAIISSLRLPITDNAGRPITYHLSHRNRRLNENETLASAEVQPGDSLTIVPEMTAGAQSGESASDALSQPPVVLAPDARTRQPASGFPPDCQITLFNTVVQVALQPGAMDQVWQQARAHTEMEVGGLLLGNVYEEEGRFLVHVEHVLEAEHARAGAAFVTFTGQAWQEMLQQRNNYPDQFVTGWYHSHPGFGIFLSMSDEFIHRSFFSNEPWYLALVVDPLSSEWGIFTLEQEEIKRCRVA